MSDHTIPPTYPKARKDHVCVYCGGPIPTGEGYTQVEGFYDGRPFRNRFHHECARAWATESAQTGSDEFIPTPRSTLPEFRH